MCFSCYGVYSFVVGMAIAVVDYLFLPLKATRPAFLSLFLAYLAGFVTLPCRAVGVGFEEPHLLLMC